ncbi:MAG: type II/IV secretion system protein [bacterium]|nr:type II/IV secretion system protein [bacterium]
MRRLKVIDTTPSNGDSPDLVPLVDLGCALESVLATGGDAAAIQAVDTILMHAAHYRASDIHLEPWDDALAIRFRIDGILHDIALLPKDHQQRIIARVKILARIVVYQRDTPQDGRIEPEGTPCGKAMRVSTFPTVNGEKIVMRILDAAQGLLPLDALGFRGDVLSVLRGFCERPQGTLLLTGPSSSGKTTTIYALLQELLTTRQTPPHIVTVEDPVEYRLRRVAQTEVNPNTGFTFEAAIRALLRQDPEVIMIGEIRDAETARSAIQAGLTGHLVISTIHSGTAAGVFTRLIDMGIEPFLLASSVTGVLAQRLVRANCPHCAAAYDPDPALRTRFGLADGDAAFLHGTGCDACQGIGYSGRTAISELLTMNDELGDLILARSRTAALHEAALRHRMTTLAEDAAIRVREGTTTLEELNRVLPPE